MNDRVLSMVAKVAGVLALIGAIWGLVDHKNSGDSEGALEETVMWIAIDLLLLSIAVLALAFSRPRPDAPRRDV